MKTAPPRLSIECEPGGEDVEQLAACDKDHIAGHPSSALRSPKDSSLEGHAGDAITSLVGTAGSGGGYPSCSRTDSSQDSNITTNRTASFAARGRSQSDSVAVLCSRQSGPASLGSCLPPEPKSFSSSCRRSAPIPALILPCTPPKPRQTPADGDRLGVTNTSATLPGPATPLTAVSIGELTPGLVQLRRAFPLPPLRREEAEDTTTPTLRASMVEKQAGDLFFVSHRLPGAFESFDSLETAHYIENATDELDRTSVAHPSQTHDSPRTPTEKLHRHHRSSSCRSASSFKPSPGSCSNTSSPAVRKQRSKRVLQDKRSKASLGSVSVGEDSNAARESMCDPSWGYDFRSCQSSPAKSLQHQQQAQRPPNPSRSASRGSWRSRYSRPDTAMSTATATTTVYEDAVDHFSGNEADAEGDEIEAPAESALPSCLAVSNSSSNSSISTIRASAKPLGRFRHSFQRRRTASPLNSIDSTGRPSSTLSHHDWNSASYARGNRISGCLAEKQVPSSSTPRSSSAQDYSRAHCVFEMGSEQTSPRCSSSALLFRPSSPYHQRSGKGLRGHTRNSASSTSEDRERPTSAMSALRPLMLTPEKTRRGSLKDWSLLPSYGSQFIEDFELPLVQAHQEIITPPLQPSIPEPRENAGQIARENPYAELYEELAKSPDIENDLQSPSPISPSVIPSPDEVKHDPSHRTTAALKPLHSLEPVVEESFIESDRSSRCIAADRSNAIVEKETSLSVEEIAPNDNSTISVSVLAITTDSPQPLSAGRQSTESRHRRTSRPPSASLPVDVRSRASSVGATLVTAPLTVTPGATSITSATSYSVRNVPIEYAQRDSRQVGHTSRMETRSPRSEGGFDHELIAFFHAERLGLDPFEEQPEINKETPAIAPPSPQERHPQELAIAGDRSPQPQASRQRTKSQPAKLRHAASASFEHVQAGEGAQLYNDFLKELLPLDAKLRKQVKSANRAVIKKASAPPQRENKSHFSKFLNSALKKRKSSPGLFNKLEEAASEEKVHLMQLPVGALPISAPLQARHLCSGTLNANVNRESPFERRPSSPVRGYIDVPFAGSGLAVVGEKVVHPLSLDFEVRPTSSTASPLDNQSGSQRSSPSQSNMSEASPSPAFFSSPLSSTSSHSEEGPSTPRAFSPSVGSSAAFPGLPADFWAVPFAEAQAGEGDFVAPHATLVKSNRLAMLSTNEKARRRASKTSSTT